MTAPSRLKNHQLRRARRLIIMEGAFGGVLFQLTQGVILTKFATELGATAWDVAVMMSVQQFAAALQVFSSWLLSHARDCRRVTLLFMFAHRLVWTTLSISALTFLHRGQSAAITALIVANGVGQLCYQMTLVGWYAWVADLAPVQFWGRFLGRRNMIMQYVTVPMSFGVGWWVDWWFAKNHHELIRAGSLLLHRGEISGLGLVLLGGCALGWTSFLILARVPAVTLHRSENPLRFDRVLAKAINDRSFRRLALTRCWLTFWVQLASPMWNFYALKFLRVPVLVMKVFEATGNFSTGAGNRACGSLADRYGYRPVALLFCFGVASIPLWWMLASRGVVHLPLGFATVAVPLYWLAGGAYTVGNFSWAGVNLCAGNFALKLAEREHRAAYVALFQGAFAVMGGCGSLVGAGLVMWASSHLHAGQLVLAFFLVFTASSLGRLSATLGFASVREEGAAPTLALARVLLDSLRFRRRKITGA